MSAKKAIFFDWDGTVCDDRQLKHRLFSIAASFGVSYESIRPIYDQTKSANGYHHQAFSEYIARQTSSSVSDVHAALLAAFNESRDFLLPDIEQFLTRHAREYDYYVVSAGDDWLQRHKISSSGLEPLFKDIHIVSGQHIEADKLSYIESQSSGYEHSVFVDDRIATIIVAHERWRHRSDISPIWMNRDNTLHYACSNNYVINSFGPTTFRPDHKFFGRSKTLIAGCVLRNSENILLVNESAGASKGLWSLPIGHVDGDDGFEQTAARELLEETSIAASSLTKPQLIVVDGGYYGGSDYDVDRAIIICLYEATPIHTNITPEHATKWFSLADAQAAKLRGEQWQSPLVESLFRVAAS